MTTKKKKLMKQTLYVRGIKTANKNWLEKKAIGGLTVGAILNQIVDRARLDCNAK